MSEPLLYQKLNLETARISWHELQPHFARGAVIVVTEDADLPQIAEWMAQDNTAQITRLLESKTLFMPDADTARRWYADNHEMWAVVVAPWVVVQEQ